MRIFGSFEGFPDSRKDPEALLSFGGVSLLSRAASDILVQSASRDVLPCVSCAGHSSPLPAPLSSGFE